MKLSGTLIYFLPLFLYTPIFDGRNETQPHLILIFSCLALFRKGMNSKVFYETLWFSALFFGVIVNAYYWHSFQYLTGLYMLAVGPIVLLSALSLNANLPSVRSLRIITGVLLALCFAELLVPVVYESLASSLLPRYGVSDGHRGISILTPEPSYAVLSIFYVFAMTKAVERSRGLNLIYTKSFLILILLLTFSTYAALILAVYLAARYTRMFFVGMAIGFIAVVVIGVGIKLDFDSIRAVTAVQNLFLVDYSNALVSLSAIDPSLGTRVYSVAASVTSLFGTWVGFGLDCFSLANSFTAFKYEAMSNEVISSVVLKGCMKPQSYLSAISLGLGGYAIFLLSGLVVLVLTRVRQKLGIDHFQFDLFCVAMVMLTVQVQITNPIPWLILYFSFIPAAISKPVTLKNLSRVDHKSHHDLINLAKLY